MAENDLEKIEMLARKYEWECPECDNSLVEDGIPHVGNALGELQCTSCKTKFQCTGAQHYYVKV